MWHLVILAVMVLIARPPERALPRAFDVAVLVLAA